MDPRHDDDILHVRDLKMHFPLTGGVFFQRPKAWVKAVDGVSLSIRRGETLGLVGESGCGKTTLGRCILRLYRPTAGRILFNGHDLTAMSSREVRPLRRRMQVIFQDPYASLNPRMTAGAIIGEPLLIHKAVNGKEELRARVAELADTVGFHPSMLDRFPHQFSSGQRQRIGVARALALNPEFIVADEPVSALDVSIQAQIINLLEELQRRFSLTYLFIAHDLSVVRHISDRVAVMYLGHVVELAKRDDIYVNPRHPYTQALLAAVPIPDPEVEATRERFVLAGETPSPINPPTGCVFHPRCPIAIERCSREAPVLKEVAPDHWAACIRDPGYDSAPTEAPHPPPQPPAPA